MIKNNDNGKTYKLSDNINLLYRNKGSVSGDNNINNEERIFLINGKVEITLKNKKCIAVSPTQIYFPKETYHKIKAITDISFILFFN